MEDFKFLLQIVEAMPDLRNTKNVNFNDLQTFYKIFYYTQNVSFKYFTEIL